MVGLALIGTAGDEKVGTQKQTKHAMRRLGATEHGRTFMAIFGWLCFNIGILDCDPRLMMDTSEEVGHIYAVL